MIVELNTQKVAIVDGKKVVTKDVFKSDLDMSIAAQLRWESKFPLEAAKEDLYGYSDRISKIESLSAAVIISKLKMLYCWFDTDIDFKEFCKMFDFADIEYTKGLVDQIQNIFQIIIDGSSEKN